MLGWIVNGPDYLTLFDGPYWACLRENHQFLKLQYLIDPRNNATIMKKIFILSLISFLSFASVGGQDITFSKDIAPIIYENCTVCHRAGEVGPMSLTSYDEVRNWGPTIKYVTEIKYMPPWKPDPHYSRFLGERSLTDEEIHKIKEWVDNGMPQGNLSEEPPLPEFPEGSQIGKPDLVLSFKQAYTHKGNNRDRYQIFVLPTGLTEDKILKGIELRPGNRRIVHHALFALDETGAAQALDGQTPEYGYPGFGGYGVPVTENYPGYVPGAKVRLYAEGMGQKMTAGSNLLIQMHYAPVPVDEQDSTTVNIFFADEKEEVTRSVSEYVMLPFGNTIQNGPFVMPPETVKRFHCKFTTPIDVSLIAVGPHMHLLGKDWEVFSVNPAGDTTNLISIPDWDFNWQGAYFFKRLIKLERGSTIHAYATYDNTSNNFKNPHFPPKTIRWGEGTEDEMFYLPFLFVPFQPGDEDIIFEPDDITTSVEGEEWPVIKDQWHANYPNPASEKTTAHFSLAASGNYSLQILNLKGQVVKTPFTRQFFNAGNHQYVMEVQDLQQGLYFIRLKGDQTDLSAKMTITRN
jgi:hypothetical protein